MRAQNSVVQRAPYQRSSLPSEIFLVLEKPESSLQRSKEMNAKGLLPREGLRRQIRCRLPDDLSCYWLPYTPRTNRNQDTARCLYPTGIPNCFRRPSIRARVSLSIGQR